MTRKHCLSFMLTLLVSGCYQRILPIRAVDGQHGVAFQLSEVEAGLAAKRKYELLDITVTKRGCTSDCEIWSVVRKAGPGITDFRGVLVSYGGSLAGTQVRVPARPLEPGGYAVSATIQEYAASGDLARSLSLDSEFDIQRDSAGTLHVRKSDSATNGGCI